MPGVTTLGMSSVTARRAAAEPFVLVIFGASGDLTQRKLIPALYGLHQDGLLPEKAAIIGFARTPKAEEAFRRESYQAARNFGARTVDEQAWAKLAGRLHYQQGDYENPEDFRVLRQRIDEIAAVGSPRNCLFYLSTPAAQFGPIARMLAESGLARRGAKSSPWSRIIIEKPFGRDLPSARALNNELRAAFDEAQVFRIDHYVGKETVQNLLVLRFANSLFEPIWNQKYVDHVQITVSEVLGVGKRGSYYDQSGALRDMLQNHLMNLLCLVAMEAPASLEADAIRDEKVQLLRSLRPIPPECAAMGVVRAQYAAGDVAGQRVPGYLEEPGVAPDSATDTYVAVKAAIDNWRWSGVPFYLRTGKRLREQTSEISIHFKSVPQVLFNAAPYGPMQPNVLAIRIQPDEGVAIQFQVKEPGPSMRIHPYQMHFSYREAFDKGPPDAYERLLLDAALGDATLFIRSDEIEAAWAFVTPILEGCDLTRGRRLPTYPPGSWGPDEADRLIAAEGNRWFIAPRNGGGKKPAGP